MLAHLNIYFNSRMFNGSDDAMSEGILSVRRLLLERSGDNTIGDTYMRDTLEVMLDFISCLVMAAAVVLMILFFAKVGKAEITDNNQFPFGKTVHVEVVGPKDFTQNVIVVLKEYSAEYKFPIAFSWRRMPRSMDKFPRWHNNPLMLRAVWSKRNTDLYRKEHRRDWPTSTVVATWQTSIADEWKENDTIICREKNDCRDAIRNSLAMR